MSDSNRKELLICATALGLGIGLISSCTTMGFGSGQARGAAITAQFAWQSKDDRRADQRSWLSLLPRRL